MFASSAGKPEFSKQLYTHSGAGVFQHPFEDQNKWSGFRVFPGTESRKHKGKPPASPTAHDTRGARGRARRSHGPAKGQHPSVTPNGASYTTLTPRAITPRRCQVTHPWVTAGITRAGFQSKEV